MQFWSRLKLRTKLIGGFAVVALLTAVVGVIGYWGVSTLSEDIQEIGLNRLPSVENLLVINEAQTAICAAETALLSRSLDAAARQQRYDRIRAAWDRSESSWKVYESLSQTKEEEAKWNEFVPVWNAWKADHQKYVQLTADWEKIRSGDPKAEEAAYQLMTKQCLETNRQTFAVAERLLSDLVKLNHDAAEKAVKVAEQESSRAVTLAVGAVIAGVLMALAFGYFLAGAIARPVYGVARVLKSVAEGDYTQTVVCESKDEIGEMAAALNQAVAAVNKAMQEITQSAGQFAEGSRVIAESSQSLAQGAQTQSSGVEEMTASIEELARSIQAVKDNAIEADSLAKRTSALAEDGGQAVQKSNEAMELIKNSSNRIAEIIQVISEIAGQTNLLALNAAIEAARAGEHGMGFAVVADEVRKLAERSNQAAREISTLIKESTQRVEEGAQRADQTGKSLHEIIEGVASTVGKISEIAAASVQQATNAEEVSKAIQEVAHVTEQTAAASEEMASSSEELGAQAAALRDLVGQFKVTAGT